jgi:redox-sensitive bicupin YhaK (pirin superfamily)
VAAVHDTELSVCHGAQRGDPIARVCVVPYGVRFLLVSGRPLEEPVAWYGPIVMNTQDELRRAFEELEAGTFLKPEAQE